MLTKHFRFLSVLLSGLFYCSISVADIDERYHLSIGSNLEVYNTELTINSGNRPANNIDLENDLGFANPVNELWVSAWYRVGDLHRISMTYTPLSRSTQITSAKDVVINGTTISAGAEISAKTTTDIIDFSYIYSFHKSPTLELGISAGIYWLLNSTAIRASGQIQSENEDAPSFVNDYFSDQKLQAPMPLIGASAIYEITPNWRTYAAIRYLSIQVNDIDGKISSVELGTEYYFNENWGAGLSLSYFDLQVNVARLLTDTTLNWAHNGVQAYVTFKY